MNGLIFNSLHSYTDDDKEDVYNTDTDKGGLESGPAQGITGSYSNEENIHVTKSFAYLNPLYSYKIN